MEINGIILLFIILFVVSSPAASKHVNKNMVSVHVQKKSRDKGIILHRKFSHGSSGHGGGRAGANGGGRAGANGGQSNSPTTRGSGTAAVFPVYAAGAAAAAGRNNYHRNAATCNHHCIGLPTLVATVLVYMLVHISVVLEF